MNVLFSTTVNWNAGDEYIHWGVRRLVEQVLGHRVNPVLYSRNPDALAMGPLGLTSDAWKPRYGLRGIDLFVQSGSPEWQGANLAPLYEELSRRRRVPIWFVGIGAAHAYELTRLDQRILRRASVVICRDRTCEAICKPYNRRAVALPCPSLFAMEEEDANPAPAHDLGVVWQRPHEVNQRCSKAVSRGTWAAAEALQKAGARIQLIAHYIDEFNKAAREGTFPVGYSFETHDYPEIFRQNAAVASTRLHGAMLGITLGIPTCMLQADDHRCVGAATEVEPLDIVAPDDLPAWFAAMDEARRAERRAEIRAFREANHGRYLEAMGG